ncbi:hypothetical protein L1887_20272 [Cichorium endivia]|nr:hypothetical protein L1887_20272 [Cichorium endivia]
MNLTSDVSGSHHGWYCNSVEVTTTGAHTPCAQQEFTVEQWLATDTSPYELTAIRNYCDYSSTRRRIGGGVILEFQNDIAIIDSDPLAGCLVLGLFGCRFGY